MAQYDERYPLIRKMLPFTTMAVVLVAIYVGWIVYSRWKERRTIQEETRQQQIESYKKSYEAYGSGQLKILAFSISTAVMQSGDTARVCYGVANAKTVTIEPRPLGNVWPSVSRCVEVAPKKTTTYTITASDDAGHTEQKSLTLQVQ